MTAFGSEFKKYRKKMGLSQEEISERLGVTSQAISKWECNRSYPDLDMLINIASIFDISLDMLLLGKERSTYVDEDAPRVLGLPDDDTLRIVLCSGNRLLKLEEGCNGVKIPLQINGRVGLLEVRGSADISGDVYGNISAGTSVCCDNVDGNVSSGTSIACDNVTGNASSGTSLACDNVTGNVSCGGSISCDDIHGDIKRCGGDICCERISGSIEICEKIVYIERDC